MYAYESRNLISARDQSKINELRAMRTSVCGIGTRKMKIRLKKLGKTNPLAYAYYCAFAAEENSITAKQYYYQRSREYSDLYYEKKESYISSLVSVCKQQGYKYGVERIADEDDYEYIKYIIYFDLPECEQVSWHCASVPDGCPKYDGEWDQAEKTTLKKLECAISRILP